MKAKMKSTTRRGQQSSRKSCFLQVTAVFRKEADEVVEKEEEKKEVEVEEEKEEVEVQRILPPFHGQQYSRKSHFDRARPSSGRRRRRRRR